MNAETIGAIIGGVIGGAAILGILFAIGESIYKHFKRR